MFEVGNMTGIQKLQTLVKEPELSFSITPYDVVAEFGIGEPMDYIRVIELDNGDYLIIRGSEGKFFFSEPEEYAVTDNWDKVMDELVWWIATHGVPDYVSFGDAFARDDLVDRFSKLLGQEFETLADVFEYIGHME